ncbi:DUF2528 family protein [Ideonella sp.]|uniref:DUF2528 family protein n=1 Tax=Ideonella sp. TaxID=1929293 RepID=UPI003BB55A77
MTTKKFQFSLGCENSITVQVDTTVMTPEIATEVNNFWSGAEGVLRASKGDIIQAVARRALSVLVDNVLAGWNLAYCAEELGKQEGWPEAHGITVIGYEFPDFDEPCGWDCVEQY